VNEKSTWTIQASAATTTQTPQGTQYTSESDFKIRKASNMVQISGYTGSATVVNIPPTIQNIPVTSIGSNVFKDRTNLTGVTIPDGVTDIGVAAFSGCTNLTSIIIPDSVTMINEGAFRGCLKLTSISLPKKMTEIYVNVFSQTGLTGVVIPNGVTGIGIGAFSNCANLTSVTIPNSVTNIDVLAFSGCTGLTSITIPASVTSIGDRVFEGCVNLTSITFQGTIPSANFHQRVFYNQGDMRDKFYATDKANGTPGTYTRPNGTSTTWAKK